MKGKVKKGMCCFYKEEMVMSILEMQYKKKLATFFS